MRSMIFLTILIALQPSLADTAQTVAQQPDGRTLMSLEGQTGWILLGVVSRDRRRWAAGTDPTVDFLAGGYEIVDRTVDRRKPILPRPGERIRLTARNQVRILDYATRGEARRLDAPPSAGRSLSLADRTGIMLEPGTVVTVRAIVVGPPRGELRMVWARIVPAD